MVGSSFNKKYIKNCFHAQEHWEYHVERGNLNFSHPQILRAQICSQSFSQNYYFLRLRFMKESWIFALTTKFKSSFAALEINRRTHPQQFFKFIHKKRIKGV